MKRSYFVLGFIFAALAVTDAILYFTLPEPIPTSPPSVANDGFDYSWTELDPYIAHAGGSIFGHTYTNSYEALLFNYQLGHRLFELDFSLTSDDGIIFVHDPAEATVDTFNSTLIEGQFHPISLNHLLDFLYRHPDVYIVTDTKYTDEASTHTLLGNLRTAAEALDQTILDRFIIQIYFPNMLPWVMDIYPWKSIIYTLYQDPDWTAEDVAAFAKTSGIKYITLFDTVATPERLDLWQSAGLMVGVHTINHLQTAKQFFDLGVTNIYTDHLLPET